MKRLKKEVVNLIHRNIDLKIELMRLFHVGEQSLMKWIRTNQNIGRGPITEYDSLELIFRHLKSEKITDITDLFEQINTAPTLSISK